MKKELLKESVEIAATEHVPGAGEIPQAAGWLLDRKNLKLDGLIATGVLIQGETSHYESLCRLLEHGLSRLQRRPSAPPVVFAVLMLKNRLQAESRIRTPGGPPGGGFLGKRFLGKGVFGGSLSGGGATSDFASGSGLGSRACRGAEGARALVQMMRLKRKLDSAAGSNERNG